VQKSEKGKLQEDESIIGGSL